MSARALAWVLERSPLSGTALLVHIVLGDLANDQHENELWMRQERIAHRARTTRQTVNRTLGEMVDAGLLEVVSTTSFGLTRFRLLLDDAAHPAREWTEPKRSRGTVPPPPPPPARVAVDDTTRVASCDTGVASRDTARVASRDTTVSQSATQEHQVITPRVNTTSTPSPSAPAVKGRGARATFTPEADTLARAEWERRTVKPVIGFVAFRARIDDALAAGHAPADVARVLPTMANFSRNAFDYALGKPTGRRLRSVPAPSTARDLPSGMVTL